MESHLANANKFGHIRREHHARSVPALCGRRRAGPAQDIDPAT